MSGTPSRFPAVALLKGGFLKSQCSEPVQRTCAECGSPRQAAGPACETCFSTTGPVSVCATCRERLSASGGPHPRPCLSQQAYERDPHRAPVFSRPEDVLWGVQATRGAPVEVLAETELQRRLASGALDRSTLVSCDFGQSFTPAEDTLTFAGAALLVAMASGFKLDVVWTAIGAVQVPPELAIPDIGRLRMAMTPDALHVHLNDADIAAEAARRDAAYRAAQATHDEVVRRSQQAWTEQRRRIGDKRKQLGKLLSEYTGLPERERSRVAHMMQREEGRQKAEFLARLLIETADIPTLGPKKKASLRAWAIRSAADVTRDAVDRIPGFGMETTASVLAWRRDCEARFVFNPKLAASQARTAQDDERRACGIRKQELEVALIAGVTQLQRLRQDTHGLQRQLDSALMTAARAVAQADADRSITALIEARRREQQAAEAQAQAQAEAEAEAEAQRRQRQAAFESLRTVFLDLGRIALPGTDDLTAVLDKGLVKSAPLQLPAGVKEFLVDMGPLILPGLLVVMAWLALASAVDTGASSLGLTVVLGLTQVVLLTLALPHLFGRKLSGWRLVFYQQLLHIAASALSGAFISVGWSILGLYVLFQVRDKYTA